MNNTDFVKAYAGNRVLGTGHSGFKGARLSLWLDRLGGFIADRKRNFAFLTKVLADRAGLLLGLPQATSGSVPSWFDYLLTLEPKAGNREELMHYLAGHKSGIRLHFAANMLHQPCAEEMVHRVTAPLDGSDVIMRRSCRFGPYPGLGQEQLVHAAGCLRRWLTGKTAS